MPDTRIETPDWIRPMEGVLGELNEDVLIIDNEMRVVFANEALL